MPGLYALWQSAIYQLLFEVQSLAFAIPDINETNQTHAFTQMFK